LYNRPKWPQYQGLRKIPRDLNRYLGTQYRPTNNNNNNKRLRWISGTV
jgi:hypothetical protein